MINNLKLEFGEKSIDYLNGQPYRTRVVLKNDDGAYYPVFFDVESVNLPDIELFQKALDVVYQKNSSGRAETEQFNLIGEKIAKYDELIEKSQKAIKELEGVTEKAIPTIAKMEEQLALADSSRTGFTSLVLLLYGKGTLTDEDLIETGLFEI